MTKKDYVGTYTEYIYADGHVETEPAGRPLFKEDMQLKRTAEAGVNSSRLLMGFSNSLNNMNKFANTVGARETDVRALLYTIPMGGV